jgi:hypothetical protein
MTDLLFPRIRPTLFNRQTPKYLATRFSLPVTGLLWGLDTGTLVSTFRTSAASWGALTLAIGGWGPWWVGIAYAAAFSVPLCLLILTYPAAGGTESNRSWRRRDTTSLVIALHRPVRHVRYAAAVTALIGVAVIVGGMS